MDKSRAYYVQSEVSWKEKNKYHLSTHVYGIQKDEPIEYMGIKDEEDK